MMSAMLALVCGALVSGVGSPPARQDSFLSSVATESATAAAKEFESTGLKPESLGICVAILDRSIGGWRIGGFRGDVGVFPASVVKAFYAAYTASHLSQGTLHLTPEFDRGLKDMVIQSSNDATALVMDTITGTTGGPELDEAAFAEWQHLRNVVNRWFSARGYTGINANQKTWNEGPYGRERQSYGPNFENRNRLTPDSCVRLFCEIALERIVPAGSGSGDWSSWLQGWFSRAIPADSQDADFQSRAFSGKVLPSGSRLWSKAGWTSTVRHDVAWVRLPDGREYVWAIFTSGQSGNTELIPWIATELLRRLSGAVSLP
jgi:hypothetical protein